MEKFLRVIQPIFELAFGPAEGLGSQGGDNLVSRVGGVLTDKSHLIDLDSWVAFERGAQLIHERLGTACGTAGGKRAHKPGQAGLRAGGGEMDAGDSGVGEETRKTAFRRRGLQWHAIDMELGARGPEQQPGFTGNFQSGAKFFPGGLELGGGPRMTEFIQAGKLQQDV